LTDEPEKNSENPYQGRSFSMPFVIRSRNRGTVSTREFWN